MTFYLSGAGAYFAFLLFKKFSDRECSKTDLASWVVMAIASAFWIAVIPLSVLEIRTKAERQAQLEDILNSSNCGSDLQPTKIESKLEFESKFS
jgi:hypothetical protein